MSLVPGEYLFEQEKDLKFSFDLRLITERYCCSLVLYTVNHMNNSHGLIFSMLLMSMEVCLFFHHSILLIPLILPWFPWLNFCFTYFFRYIFWDFWSRKYPARPWSNQPCGKDRFFCSVDFALVFRHSSLACYLFIYLFIFWT